MLRNFAAVHQALRTVSIILLIWQSGAVAHASPRPMPSIEWSFEAAAMVVLLRVDKSEVLKVGNDVCGVRYTATILESFKGAKGSKGPLIQFGRFSGLDTEKTYLAFLEFHADPEVEYRRFRDENELPDIVDETEKRRVMSQVTCKGLVPGLVVDDRFTWPVELNYLIGTGLRPSNIPGDIRVYPAESAQWWIQKQDLFSYLRTLRHHKY